MKLRLLHFLIFSCIAMLGVKASDMQTRNSSLSEILFVSDIRAQESGEDSSADSAEGDVEESDVVEEGEEADSDSTEEDSNGNDDEEGDEEIDDEDDDIGSDFRKDLTFTETEVEILKRLQQRRSKLDQWEDNLKVKNNVLKVTQTKIDQKLAELRSLKNEVKELLDIYNEKDDAKLKSLVKIYESMKPKNAAKIFEDLDMDVILLVIDRMKESKSALILSKMGAEKAKDLTVRFAEQRKLSEPNR